MCRAVTLAGLGMELCEVYSASAQVCSAPSCPRGRFPHQRGTAAASCLALSPLSPSPSTPHCPHWSSVWHTPLIYVPTQLSIHSGAAFGYKLLGKDGQSPCGLPQEHGWPRSALQYDAFASRPFLTSSLVICRLVSLSLL